MTESNDFRQCIARIAVGDPLSEEESEQAFHIIMAGEATPAQIGAFLMGLHMRGETVDEITGALRVMRANVTPVNAPMEAMDIVGTGGDGVGTWNISTAAAFVVAGAGVPIAKHGNRAASSQSGSADVLTALGVNVDAPVALMEKAMIEARIGFMFAQRHHLSMRHVGPVRAEMGIRTLFNLLGPMSNPASVTRQFTGVFDARWLRPMAEALHRLGSKRAWLVHGYDGLDEISLTGPSYVVELNAGAIREFEVSPEQVGLTPVPMKQLLGGTPEDNARALLAVLDGAAGPYRDIVLLNAAGALIVAGQADDLTQGMELARASIGEARARHALDTLIRITNQA